jgi:hypothetical protein
VATLKRGGPTGIAGPAQVSGRACRLKNDSKKAPHLRRFLLAHGAERLAEVAKTRVFRLKAGDF